MKTIRSHRVDSPSAHLTATTGRPNACNQCHLDQTLASTAEHLSAWYGQEPLPVEAPRDELSQAVELLLAGDAVQRAVTAANFGRSEALAASGHDWQPGLLAQLLDDPYAVVRYVAGESLRQYPGFADFEYDFLAPPEERATKVQQAVANSSAEARENRAVLIDASGRLDTNRLRNLQERRDDRPISLPE